MLSPPFVSVVTVSLNAARTIGDTMASVAMQTCAFALEHICVDGGSTDGTRSIIDDWASRSSNIRRLYEPDRGIFDAMNKGLGLARGEYVLFLNADDFLIARDTLARALAGLTPGRPDIPDLILGGVVMGVPERYGLWRRRAVPRLLARLRGFGLYPPHQGMLARRQLLERVGGFDARLRYSGDLYQYYEMERRSGLSIRRLNADVALMRPGGGANSSVRTMLVGSLELFRCLRPSRGAVRAALMVSVKTLQSLCEVRVGTTGTDRWFDQSLPAA